MRKLVTFGLSALLVAAFVAPQALAADDEAKFKFSGEVRTRAEYLENYLDFTNNSSFDLGDKFSFYPYRVRLGVEGEVAPNVKVFAEFQNAGTFGLHDIFSSDEGAGYVPFGQGFGPVLYAYPVFASALDPAFGTTFVNQNDALLYQGYVELGHVFAKDLSVRIGRQEHTLGTQLLLGDNAFYNGISYDGAHIMWHPEKYGIDGFFYKLNETLVSSSDVNLFGVTGNIELGKKMGDIDIYGIRVQNLGNSSSQGSFGYPTPGIFPENTGLNTFGARWGRMVKNADDMKEGAFDWNIELAVQSGDFTFVSEGTTNVDFEGNIAEGWFGWNFGTGSGRSRVHVGALMASGQPQDETGNKYKAFVPLFGNNYAYNRLGDLDLFDISDINDINVGYCYMTANDRHKVGVMVHSLELNKSLTVLDPIEGVDKTIKKLGTEIDLRYTFNLNPVTSFSAGFATLMPGDVFDEFVRFATGGGESKADGVNRVYAQVRVRF